MEGKKILPSYGVGGAISSDIKRDDLRTEAELGQSKLEKEKENRIIEKTNQRLRDLAPNDEIYEAMENFLLGDPENQIQMLGPTSDIIKKGDDARNKSEDLIARAQYETAAKIAIYKQDQTLVKNSLEMASQVTKPADRHARMQKTILTNLDQVLRIARDYYKTKEEISSETEAEFAQTSNAESKKP